MNIDKSATNTWQKGFVSYFLNIDWQRKYLKCIPCPTQCAPSSTYLEVHPLYFEPPASTGFGGLLPHPQSRKKWQMSSMFINLREVIPILWWHVGFATQWMAAIFFRNPGQYKMIMTRSGSGILLWGWITNIPNSNYYIAWIDSAGHVVVIFVPERSKHHQTSHLLFTIYYLPFTMRARWTSLSKNLYLECRYRRSPTKPLNLGLHSVGPR